MFDRLKKFFKKIDCVSSCCNKKTEHIMIIRCVSCSELFKHSSLCLDCFLQHAPQNDRSPHHMARPQIPPEWRTASHDGSALRTAKHSIVE